MKKLLLFGFLIVLFSIFATFIKADEIEDVKREIERKQSQVAQTQIKIEELKKEQERLSSEIKKLSGKITTTASQINELAIQIESTKQRISELESILDDRQEKLSKQKSFRDTLVRSLYKKSQITAVELLISNEKLAEVSQRLAFHAASLNEVKKVITNLNKEITQFEADKTSIEESKKALENNLASLAKLKSNLLSQEASTKNQLSAAAKERSAAESQTQSLEAAIKGLTQKQRELLAQKFAASSQNTTVGENVPLAVELPPPPFNPSFAFASFGYPHRVGMNQFGAYGRAKAGQNSRQILEAYYSLDGSSLKIMEGYPVPETIPVEGYGDTPFEDNYLKGIAEMPSSWPIEALKAQAIAARSYALSYVSGGGSICTDQRCQVYIGRNKGGSWEQAVNETRGMVIIYNGSPIKAWYSSTHGGYTRTSEDVWGKVTAWTRRLKDYGPNGAYDGPSYGNSPWYHKAWGNRVGGVNCQKEGYNPWLSATEVEDVFNGFLLSEADSSTNQFLSPPDGCNLVKGWSPGQVKDELIKRGKKDIGKITAVFTSQDGTGYTDYIYVDSANYGQTRFDGFKFKNIFNLRSIGNLVVWTSFYDVIIK